MVRGTMGMIIISYIKESFKLLSKLVLPASKEN